MQRPDDSPGRRPEAGPAPSLFSAAALDPRPHRDPRGPRRGLGERRARSESERLRAVLGELRGYARHELTCPAGERQHEACVCGLDELVARVDRTLDPLAG